MKNRAERRLMAFWGILVVCVLYGIDLCGQENGANEEKDVYSPDDLEMTIRTDRKIYNIDEPVTLLITITNKCKSSRIITDSVLYEDYDITVLTPLVNEKDIPECPNGWDKDMFYDIFKQKPLQLTEYGKSTKQPNRPVKKNLFSGQSHVEKIPLGLLFDLSSESDHRMGEYTVIVRSRSLSRELKTTFKLENGHVCSSYIAAREMVSMLGETQSRELLCDEADKLLGELEGKEDPKMQLAAFEHERLTTCLDMLEQLHLGFFNRRADKGRIVWTIDSGRKLVDVCKSYRKY